MKKNKTKTIRDSQLFVIQWCPVKLASQALGGYENSIPIVTITVTIILIAAEYAEA